MITDSAMTFNNGDEVFVNVNVFAVDIYDDENEVDEKIDGEKHFRNQLQLQGTFNYGWRAGAGNLVLPRLYKCSTRIANVLVERAALLYKI